MSLTLIKLPEAFLDPKKQTNKLKSLKVAQVKDEMDDDEDDGCDVAW